MFLGTRSNFSNGYTKLFKGYTDIFKGYTDILKRTDKNVSRDMQQFFQNYILKVSSDVYKDFKIIYRSFSGYTCF